MAEGNTNKFQDILMVNVVQNKSFLVENPFQIIGSSILKFLEIKDFKWIA